MTFQHNLTTTGPNWTTYFFNGQKGADRSSGLVRDHNGLVLKMTILQMISHGAIELLLMTIRLLLLLMVVAMVTVVVVVVVIKKATGICV